MRLIRRRTKDAKRDDARIRAFVESHREAWQGARALYREGSGFSLVRIDQRIDITKRGLSTAWVPLPTPGLTARRARSSMFLSWEASSFTPHMWHNPYVPMTVWFNPSLIDATLEFVARLDTCEGGVDPIVVRNFVNRFRSSSAGQRRPR
jgi:hypothetical protein